jgi:hypothetical protein
VPAHQRGGVERKGGLQRVRFPHLKRSSSYTLPQTENSTYRNRKLKQILKQFSSVRNLKQSVKESVIFKKK